MSIEPPAPTSMIGVWDYNVTTDRVHSNDRAAILCGVDPVEARQGTSQSAYMSTIHSDDVDRIHSRVLDAIRRRGTYSEIYQMRDAYGRLRTVSASGACFENAEGDLLFPGTFIDLTEEQVIASRNGDDHTMAQIAECCMRARAIADKHDLKVTKHLLDMTLGNFSMKVHALLASRRRDWL
ncbi:PAS domain-containing protein [Terrihabitans rhizophilus]|uniref:PAS domain-containing protein n=1 Tax=Terrihabitans rhizophilus TaxID=3092662 RepID=A0ABU4RRH5_9HYPH|nr:PAS domain-containing protein [Terrihabitans sp. PJ23]MDX6807422.1 PAS domain-containing protein [Terrihabitans sp. PJ23]